MNITLWTHSVNKPRQTTLYHIYLLSLYPLFNLNIFVITIHLYTSPSSVNSVVCVQIRGSSYKLGPENFGFPRTKQIFLSFFSFIETVPLFVTSCLSLCTIYIQCTLTSGDIHSLALPCTILSLLILQWWGEFRLRFGVHRLQFDSRCGYFATNVNFILHHVFTPHRNILLPPRLRLPEVLMVKKKPF